MDVILIIALNIAAIVFFLLELFVLPGITIAAFAGLGCMIYSIYHAFANLGNTAGCITWVASGVIALITIYYFVKWKKIDKYSLKENIKSTVDRTDERSIAVGDKGVSTTRLALYGRATINGKNIEVKSATDFINENEEVIVTKTTHAEVIVKRATE